MQNAILVPAAVLVLWSIIVLVWMAATRIPNLKKHGIDMKSRRGGRGQNLEGVLPDEINWKAHNYAHLMEQPTLFYAVILILAVAGHDGNAVIAAWIYAGLRVVHSLWQCLVNTIPVRMALFMASTIVLAYLAVNALLAVI